MIPDDDHNIFDELSPSLLEAVKQVRVTCAPADIRLRSVLAAKRIAGSGALPRRRLGRIALAVCALAAGLLMVLSLFDRTDSSAAWAQVVKAVRSRPWIHAVSQVDGETNQIHVWHSPSQQIVATNIGMFAVYSDLRSGVQFRYESFTNTVYRQPLDDETKKGYHRSLAVWDALFRGDEVASAPILGHMEVTDQKKRTIKDGDRRWIEYELTLQDDLDTAPISCLIQVDPKTNLPHSVMFEGESLGPDLARMTFKYSYPDEGPTDIYDIGVPKHAMKIDLVLSPELDRLVKTVARSRDSFDPYYGLVVESGAEQRWWEAEAVYRVWKNADRWRVERTNEVEKDRLKSFARPDASVDSAKWWKEAADHLSFSPILVCDGLHRYVSTSDSDGEPSVKKWQKGPPSLLPTSMPAGPELPWRMMPELMAFPVFGLDSTDFQPTLDMDADGPQGTVRLNMRWTKPVFVNKFDSRTFWIDPAKGYVAVRWETRPEDDHPEDPQQHLYQLEELAQTPGKLWYPTVLRWAVDGRPAKVLRYYCNFNLPMPARLFQSPGATDGQRE